MTRAMCLLLSAAVLLLPSARRPAACGRYKDAERREACSAATTYTGKLRLGTAYALLQTTITLQERLEDVTARRSLPPAP